ncbi:MAG: CapA family protein [Clostridia bacterium]|nr:CapA family protein [Clostridia bacterium]
MKLVICGDVTVTPESYPHFNNANEKSAFGDVLEVFKSADRVIVNLECAITQSDNEIRKFGPCLKAPLNTAYTLKKAGITDCALSNNHIFDFGVEGLRDTINALEKQKIKWTGIGKNYEASRKNHTITVGEITVSVINVCEHEYSYATSNRVGARPFDEFETMQDIRLAKKEADYVVVIYHGGKELCSYPSPRLMKACHEMVRCGADCVLCQHSHIIGCYENFEGGHILYGQGNFHFAKNDKSWRSGLITMLNIDKDGINIDFIPVSVENGTVRIADEENNIEILSAMEKRNKSLSDGTWKEYWHEFCVSRYEDYKRAFCGYNVDDDEDKTQYFAHTLDCEAHTDVWRELFKTWNYTNELGKEL